MPFMTLTTDFGTRDGNVGVMKGVIWGIAPDAKISDLSHLIEAQNIRQAAFVLNRHAFYFPEGTVHVVVVDPGVGTQRRPIAARIGTQLFVGPDNGVFTLLYERAEDRGWPLKVVHTDKPAYWLDTISNVFHGRDIFSPVGAHLASGVPLEELGTEIDDAVRIMIPKPERTPEGVRGEVVHIDHFGNLASNIHRSLVEDLGEVEVRMGDLIFNGLVKTFGERPAGELIALYSSTDYLFIAEVNGNAAARTQARVGDPVEIVKHS